MGNPIFTVEEASREKSKASIMIEGLSGQGKSGLALIIGRVLSGAWEKTGAVDTENRSLKLFAGVPSTLGEVYGKFKIGNLDPEIGYKPTNYLTYRDVLITAGCTTIIEDSISHAWQYKGGILDMVNAAQAKQSNKSDKYGAWRDEDVQREKNELLQLIRDPRCHVITTVRVKEKFVPETDDGGKTFIKSLGEQQIMQDDIKYEPDLVLHMTRAGNAKVKPVIPPKAIVIKSRYAIFTEGEEYEFTPELLEQLKEYLDEGTDPEVLLEQQHQDYIAAMTKYLDTHTSARPIWAVIKADAGFKDTKLADIPLQDLKPLFLKLTT
jgi:hypothetical protein